MLYSCSWLHMLTHTYHPYLGTWNPVDGFQVTDPVIHAAGQKHKNGITDKWADGITAFYATHICNSLCKALGLSTPFITSSIYSQFIYAGAGGRHSAYDDDDGDDIYGYTDYRRERAMHDKAMERSDNEDLY